MNRWIFHSSLLMLCFNGALLSADFETALKPRIAGFYPSGSLFRKVYGNVMPNYQLEATQKFCGCYEGFVNIDWLNKNGRSGSLNYFTNIKVVNLSFGATFHHDLSQDFSVYAGLGLSVGSIRIHNRNTSHHHYQSKYALGGVIKSGIIYDIDCRYFVELFVDYLYEPVKFISYENIGGAKTGLGIGIRF